MTEHKRKPAEVPIHNQVGVGQSRRLEMVVKHHFAKTVAEFEAKTGQKVGEVRPEPNLSVGPRPKTDRWRFFPKAQEVDIVDQGQVKLTGQLVGDDADSHFAVRYGTAYEHPPSNGTRTVTSFPAEFSGHYGDSHLREHARVQKKLGKRSL